jgi:hypothetical protein
MVTKKLTPDKYDSKGGKAVNAAQARAEALKKAIQGQEGSVSRQTRGFSKSSPTRPRGR